MNIMNKLYKCALGLLTTFILSICYSNASYVTNGVGMLQYAGNSTNTLNFTNFNGGKGGGDTRCMINDPSNYCNLTATSQYTNESVTINASRQIACLTGLINSQYSIVLKNNSSSQCQQARSFLIDSENWRPDYTSLQCQTEYNLIPIEEVTANYCKLNFGMIDPQECPLNSGTGTIVRSNLMINDIPYAQNQNINVFIPDFLAWNIAFNDFNTVIEVEGYNADEEYIENVINQEKLTPTNKDIENMITGFMTNYFPYLALAIVFLYLARKIFKLFK